MSDVLIIGGGIAGLSAAARIAPFASVTVLEAEDSLGYHATGRSAAMFLKDYGNDVVRALNYASAEFLSEQGLLNERSMMLLGKHDQRDAFEREYPGFNMETLSVTEARDKFPILNPDTVGYVGYREGIYDLDTDLMVQGFVKTARAYGAQIETNARVRSITKTNEGWQVLTSDRVFTAPTLINAAGAWADQIAQLAGVKQIGLQPFRRSFAQLASPAGFDMSDWPFVDGVDEAWYAKPSAGKLLVSPSEEDPVDPFDAYADDMVLAEGLARYEEMVTEAVTRPEVTWAGLRSFAPDRALVIGRDPVQPSFVWCAGQGGYGFQTAPAASCLLADILGGKTSTLESSVVTSLSPARFA